MARRVLLPCLLSMLLYGLSFGCFLDRPLSLGMFRSLIQTKLARGMAVSGPKLVIIAGSNGPYSHRCETMEPILSRPCVNAGIAVGIGLDYLFALWRPVLHAGDAVYLPLEEVQYTRNAAANALGPDAAIMLRHDRTTLWTLPRERWIGAAFSFGPRAALMSLIEMTLSGSGFVDPREAFLGTVNAWGDHVGHTPEKGELNQARLAVISPFHETPERIAAGYGTVILRDFLGWAKSHGVRVVGGLPPGFDNSPAPAATRAEIAGIYAAAGAGFIDLGDQDRFPRADFFDTPDHLNEPAQIQRSRVIAAKLQAILAQAQAASR